MTEVIEEVLSKSVNENDAIIWPTFIVDSGDIFFMR